MIPDNKTLKISNYTFAKLCCCALSDKIYLSKDKFGLYIKLSSLFIENICNFIHPQFKVSEHFDETINYAHFLDEVKTNNEIKVYITGTKNATPISITSLLGGDMVITIKKEDKWYELTCTKVELSTNSLNEPIAKVYLHNYLSPPTYETTTLSELHLWSYRERQRIDRSTSIEHRFVQFSVEHLYSIEVRGKLSIASRELQEDETNANWRIGSIPFSHLNLIVDFDRKIIFGNYSSGIEEDGGRRTSNGWINTYSETEAFFYKSFELLLYLQQFIAELPQMIKPINGVVEIKDIPKNNNYQKEIIIKFGQELNFQDINQILNFDIQSFERCFDK